MADAKIHVPSEYTQKVLARINKMSVYVPRGATSGKKIVHINKERLAKIVISEGYGEE